MSTFAQAVVRHNNATVTENGMPALKSSLNACVDLFFSAGASRGKNINAAFQAALTEDRDTALRLALWLRDVRGGAGERQLFRDLLVYLESKDEAALLDIFHLIPEMGRWDDLFVFKTKVWQDAAFQFVGEALMDGNGLAAKWTPRKGDVAVAFRKFLGWSPKFYRKSLVELSNTVEQKMCAGQWDAIEFGKLPSLASARYQKAFLKRAPEAYASYKAALVKGEAKINASAVYPYDVLKSVDYGDQVVAEAQWNALPNYLTEGVGILPMIDVSGSMCCPAGGSPTVQCIDVAIGLGLYIATKQTGAFANMFLSFSTVPKLNVLQNGTLRDKFEQIRGDDWGMSTNLEAAFTNILAVAKKNSVPTAEMPKYILIFSDMQFNGCVKEPSDTAYTMICRQYEEAGYKAPNVIFWNLNDRGNNKPVEHSQKGTALVSGFSPALMQSILGAKTVTPVDIMNETLQKDRYNYSQK
jgi:hypothetical protein